MSIIYLCVIISVLLLLTFTALSFIRSENPLVQLAYIIVASVNIGVISSIILVNYEGKSAIIWPALFMAHVVSKAITLGKAMKRHGLS